MSLTAKSELINFTITPPANNATLTVSDGKTLAALSTLTFSGTDGTSFVFPATNSTVVVTGLANEFTVGQQINTGLTLGKAGTSTGSLLLKGTTSGTVTITTPSVAGTWTWTLPTDDGLANQFLQTNGSGVTSWATAMTAMTPLVVSGAGFAVLPAGPSAGVSVATGGANAYGSYTELRSASGNAIYIYGITLRKEGAGAVSYYQIMIGKGTAASEVAISEVFAPFSTSTAVGANVEIILPFQIPVAAGVRIAVKAASNAATDQVNVSLLTIDQANVA